MFVFQLWWLPKHHSSDVEVLRISRCPPSWKQRWKRWWLNGIQHGFNMSCKHGEVHQPTWGMWYTSCDWWFGTFFIFPYIGNIIIPTDEYFSEGLFYHQPVMFDACWCIVDVLRLIELVCGYFVVQIVDVFISEAGWTKTILKMRSSRFLDLMHIKHTLW